MESQFSSHPWESGLLIYLLETRLHSIAREHATVRIDMSPFPLTGLNAAADYPKLKRGNFSVCHCPAPPPTTAAAGVVPRSQSSRSGNFMICHKSRLRSKNNSHHNPDRTTFRRNDVTQLAIPELSSQGCELSLLLTHNSGGVKDTNLVGRSSAPFEPWTFPA